ncbi:MAG TPA: hypothetical protein VIL48_16350 [Acidimicrobiales bacterium]
MTDMTQKGGLMAGAARVVTRPGTCAALHLGYAAKHAPAHTRKWLVSIQAVSPVFALDRARPRPSERSP